MRMMVLLGLLRVSPSAHEVKAVRRWLYDLLGDGHAAVADDAVVGTCELVTNSIKHSDTKARGGEISIAALSVNDKRLRVEVVDDGSSRNRPILRKVTADAQSGRGLQIVAKISGGRWGSEADGTGQMVWFEVPAPSPVPSERNDAREEVHFLADQDVPYHLSGKIPASSLPRAPCPNSGSSERAPGSPDAHTGENGGAGMKHLAPSAPQPPTVVPYGVPPEARAAVAAEIRIRFPGVTPWYGNATHRWWALVPDGGRRGRLVEANTPAELATAIARIRIYP